MSKDTGGPAFPRNYIRHVHNGMTLRDYFAAKAMQGEIASPDGFEKPEHVAEFAYQVADAMLKAREES